MEVSIGPLADLPTDRCVAVADGRAVAVRWGDEAVVLPNRCVHRDLPLADGWVSDGVLSCPQHFWRFELATGNVVGTDAGLDRLTARAVDGEVLVDLPPPRRPLTPAEILRANARRDRSGHRPT